MKYCKAWWEWGCTRFSLHCRYFCGSGNCILGNEWAESDCWCNSLHFRQYHVPTSLLNKWLPFCQDMVAFALVGGVVASHPAVAPRQQSGSCAVCSGKIRFNSLLQRIPSCKRYADGWWGLTHGRKFKGLASLSCFLQWNTLPFPSSGSGQAANCMFSEISISQGLGTFMKHWGKYLEISKLYLVF